MTVSTDDRGLVLERIERLAWHEYVAGRMAIGGLREVAARRNFEERCQALWRALAEAARRSRQSLDFGVVDVRLLVIKALAAPCEYCGETFGLGCFGMAWDNPPGRSDGEGLCQARNAVACCIACAKGKGGLSGSEWRDVVAALRAADPTAAREALLALAAGRKEGRSGGL